jgi:hypothetical protein
MVLLGDEAQVEAHFGPFTDSANLNAILVHSVVPNVPLAQKKLWSQKMELLGDVGHVESRFSLFGDSVSAGAI